MALQFFVIAEKEGDKGTGKKILFVQYFFVQLK